MFSFSERIASACIASFVTGLIFAFVREFTGQ
jgi:hypothetical protein